MCLTVLAVFTTVFSASIQASAHLVARLVLLLPWLMLQAARFGSLLLPLL